MALVVFVAGQRAKSADVNANFSGLSDGSLDVTANSLATTRKEYFSDYVRSGCTMATSANLTTTLTSGVAYVNGKRIAVGSTSITVVASKDTYVYLKDDGTVSYTGSQSVANGAASPTAPTNSDGSNQLLIGKLISSGTAITTSTQTGVDSLNNQIYPISPVSNSWQSWTPTITNLTIGNGTTTAKYTRIGRTISFRIAVVFGTTTSMGTNPIFTLPVTSVTYAGVAQEVPIGIARVLDSGITSFMGLVVWINTTTMSPQLQVATGTYTQNTGITSIIPMTWGTADELHLFGQYEVA